MNILLFDMDGVLLTPGGYQKALQQTVRLFGHALGYLEAELTLEDIAQFEAAGLTSEWDSSAVCAALMLKQLWQHAPGVAYPDSVDVSSRLHALSLPELRPFFKSYGEQAETQQPIHEKLAKAVIADTRLNEAQQAILADILANTASLEASLTHRIFQELVLGSQEFAHSYQLAPQFDTDSYLSIYDQSNLDGECYEQLLTWLMGAENAAVILTNRPSAGLDGVFSTPEAEIGATLVGLQALPIAGQGGLLWLAQQRGVSPRQLNKPAPLHALAALRLATGASLSAAFEAAAAAALDGQFDPGWQALEGAQVQVFEDSSGGLHSLLGAAQLLHGQGIHMDVKLHGVSDHPGKRAALAAAGAQLHGNLKEALTSALEC